MSIKFGSNNITIQNAWSSITGSIVSKGLSTQYEEDAEKYVIFAPDDNIIYTTVIYKGTVPDVFLVDQPTNDAAKTDFETNYKPTANARTQLIAVLSGSVAGTKTVVTGTVNLDRGNSASVPLFVSGSFSVTPSGVQTVAGSVAVYTQGAQQVSGSVSVFTQGPQQVTGSVSTYTQGPQAVSGSVAVYTQGPQAVSGTVNIGTVPVIGVTGSVAVYTQGPQAVSGSVSVYTQGAQLISGSVTISGASVYTQGAQLVSGSVAVYTQGPQAVSGSVAVYTQGPQAVSGTVTVNFPVVQAVSGSQLTGSTFAGSPVVVGGVDASGFVRGIRTDVLGAVVISSTGSIKTYDTGVQAVSGSVSVFTQGAQQVTGSVAVYTQGPQAVTGSVAVYTQGAQLISGSVTISGASVYTQGAQLISGSVAVYTQGPQAVSGTVGINNFPAVQAVSGSQVTGSTFAGSPVVVGGTDASGFVRGIRTDALGAISIFASSSLPVTGTVLSQGPVASGSLAVGNPVFVAGIDPQGFIRPQLMEADGTGIVRQREEATFVAWVTGSAIGNGKSMLSILNAAGSPVVVKVREIYLINIQEAVITGINAVWELRRMKGHSGGTAIASGSIETMDLVDSLNSNVTIRTGASAITSESSVLLWRAKWSTDEWGTGSTEDEDNEHSFQTMFPIYQRRDPNEKPITLRAGDGLTVKQIINSTQGTMDLAIVFTLFR